MNENERRAEEERFKQVRSQEYEFLRTELNINRQFIFERPLLIVGVSFAAFASASDKGGVVQGFALFVVLLLIFNLWFTFNRLSSSSRILGYLRVVHEGADPVRKPGWETALSLQREWLVANRETYATIKESSEQRKMHDANRFHGGIFVFHLAMGALALLLGFPGLDKVWASAQALFWVAACLVYVLGVTASLAWWNPYRPRNSLEIQSEAWKRILGVEPGGASGSTAAEP